MSRKKKDIVASNNSYADDFVKYDYGHLTQQCFVCGEIETRLKDINGGLQLYLPVTDKHELRLTCSRCGASIRLFYTKSDKIKTEEEKQEEQKKQLEQMEKYAKEYKEQKEKEVSEKDEMVVSRKKTIKTVKKDAVHKGRKKEKPILTNRENT